MHGSANWLTGAFTIDRGSNQFSPMQDARPEVFFTYEHAEGPYSCHDGRWEKVYHPFTYGYYPPNLPIDMKSPKKGMALYRGFMRGPLFPNPGKHDSSGLTSMPLIIPPVKHKSYQYYGKLFDEIWNKAELDLVNADSITFIGYSFPLTDTRSVNLFKQAFLKRKTMPVINIIDPAPDRIIDLMVYTLGITPDKLNVYREYFSSEMDLEKILKIKTLY